MDDSSIEIVLQKILSNQNLISNCEKSDAGSYTTTYGTTKSTYFFTFKDFNFEVGFHTNFDEEYEISTQTNLLIIYPEGVDPKNSLSSSEKYSVYTTEKKVSHSSGSEYQNELLFRKIDELFEVVKSKAIGTDKVIDAIKRL